MTEQPLAWTPRINPRPKPASLTVPARLTWKDASGAVRFASVTAREFTDDGVSVDCESSVALPLFRLVHLQVEKSAREALGVPALLREGRVLSAIWKVGSCRPSTGTPGSYALRFMVEKTARPAVVEDARRAS